MYSKNEIDYRLKLAVGQVERDLLAHYPAGKALPVIERLRHILKNLNYSTHKTSVAIFASPVEEKIAYLDIPVENKIVIDQSFSIRDLVYCKKQDARYLLFQLSSISSKTWLGQGDRLRLIQANASSQIPRTDEFLHRMDQGLSQLLKAYQLPVFVVGPQDLLGRFAHITHHTADITAYIHKDLPHSGEDQLLCLLQPYIEDWQRVKQTNSIRLVDGAFKAGKLIQGTQAILEAAARKNNRLLVIEKGFKSPSAGSQPSNNQPFYIRDNVDIVIQKVLESGGDVEFVDNGMLSAYGQIALVQHY